MKQEDENMECPNCKGEIVKAKHGNVGNFFHCRKCGTVVYRRNAR